MLMHDVASLLVGVAPVLMVVAIPVLAIAIRRKHLFWFGLFGWLLLLACSYMAVTDNPHGRSFDSIDYGLLTGIPTVLVLLTSTYTLGMCCAVLWEPLFRRGRAYR